MQFTPVPALLGGLCLGLASLAKFAITCRILGISGALKGFVQGRVTLWRVLFTAGMLGVPLWQRASHQTHLTSCQRPSR